MPRLAGERELGDDLTDDRAKLEAVAREAGGDHRLRAVGVEVDEKVLVGAVFE